MEGYPPSATARRQCSVGQHGRILEWAQRDDKSSDIWSWINRRPALSRPLQRIQDNSKSSVASQTFSETHNKTLQVPPTIPLKLPDLLNAVAGYHTELPPGRRRVGERRPSGETRALTERQSSVERGHSMVPSPPPGHGRFGERRLSVETQALTERQSSVERGKSMVPSPPPGRRNSGEKRQISGETKWLGKQANRAPVPGRVIVVHIDPPGTDLPEKRRLTIRPLLAEKRSPSVHGAPENLWESLQMFVDADQGNELEW